MKENENVTTRQRDLLRLREWQNHFLGNPDSVSRYNWMYEDGVALLGLIQAHRIIPDHRTWPFVERYLDAFVDEEGRVNRIEGRPHSVDSLNNGKVILAAYEKTGNPRYEKALSRIYARIGQHPRISGTDVFAHKAVYPDQLWLDGLYMLQPLYAALIGRFGDASQYDHVVGQFSFALEHSYDRETGLFYHGYDHSRRMFWCDRETGLSSCFWGRAVGWLSMALVDCYELFPADQVSRRKALADMIRLLAQGLIRWQDETGLWHQVLNEDVEKGNYREASCSCMFTYFFAKAVRLGILSRDHLSHARRALEGIYGRLIDRDPAGALRINHVCLVAGLGPDKKPERDGSFAYYVGEPQVSNDNKARGPLLLALTELARL